MKTDQDELEQDLAVIVASTPGPWEWHVVDDRLCMNARTITTAGESGELDHHANNIAIVPLQGPRYADVADGRWDENAEFIVRARVRWPEAVERIIALERQVDSLRREISDLRRKASGR